ncbi:hypothetical protein SDC9_23745 [bioreactor metagenome]|uniref:Uncharacterized protein n=1 Tax=bioreactor metagenome TaxID=1076179 RepID=A0A644UFW2_9ZZZZ
MSEDWEAKRKAQEWLILLVLGAAPEREISMLHLEKEVFLLWKFHPSIPQFITFVAYQRGPYSSEIRDAITAPYYLTEEWEYRPPTKKDDLTGGFVFLTLDGIKKYKDYYAKMLKKEDMRSLLAGIRIVRTTYDELSPEELLLLIYDTYPDFRTKSEVAKEIYDQRDKIVEKLYKRGIVSESKAEYLKEAKWYS